MKGSVYLLTDGELYKIGVTRGSIDKRISKLQTGNPYTIQMISHYDTDKPFKLEKILHFRHSSQRINNEWFQLTNENVSNFNNECSEIEKMLESVKDNPFISKTTL